MYYHTHGIILKRKDYRENDGIFSIYTSEKGRIEVAAKGTKKIKSKLSPHLNYFSLIDLMVARGKNFNQVAGAMMIKDFSNIKSDLFKTILASYCLEVLEQLIKVEHKDKQIWDLALAIFNLIDEKLIKSELEKKQLECLARAFALKLISAQGYSPELENCVFCKSKIIPNSNIFSFSRGGLMCGKCQKINQLYGSGNSVISTNAIKVQRMIIKEDLEKFSKLKMKPNLIKEVMKIIDSFLAMHLDRELKTIKWLKLPPPLNLPLRQGERFDAILDI
jgi:DNA repair protein RecO (recombination protein O)